MANSDPMNGRESPHMLNINGKPIELDSPEFMPLLWTLRDVLSMSGTIQIDGHSWKGDMQITRTILSDMVASAILPTVNRFSSKLQ
jgi:aerobic-type carbon monoxide dehydrogenase small subunit (CoxS/CutS family)